MRDTDIHFHTICPCCDSLVQVQAIDGKFRWPMHKWKRGWLAGQDCSYSDTPWEPK
jgi:hypothetical protein